MSYRVIAIPNFIRKLKKLAHKFPSIKSDFVALVQLLQNNPKQGVALGNDCYKIRWAITSKGKGKSGGASDNLLEDLRNNYLPALDLR